MLYQHLSRFPAADKKGRKPNRHATESRRRSFE
jgi:hypothetical protein